MTDPNPYAPPAAPPEPRHEGTADLRTALIGARVQASMLDGVLSIGIALPVLLIASATKASGSGLSVIVILTIAALWAYQWYLVCTTGQTLGKRWAGVRIVKVDGSPLSFVSAVVLRSWVFALLGAIPGIGPLLGLADVLAIFGSEHRCLHDQLAGTKVVVA